MNAETKKPTRDAPVNARSALPVPRPVNKLMSIRVFLSLSKANSIVAYPVWFDENVPKLT